MTNAGNPSVWQPQEIAANERAYSQHMFFVCKDAYNKMRHGDYNSSLLAFELSISGFEKLIQVHNIYLSLLAAICYEGSRVALFGAHNRNKAILLAEKAQFYTKVALQNNLKIAENVSIVDAFSSALKSADSIENISKLYFAGFPVTDTDYTEQYAFFGESAPVAQPLNKQEPVKKKNKLTAISISLVILAVAMLVTLCITAFIPSLRKKSVPVNQNTSAIEQTRLFSNFQTVDNDTTADTQTTITEKASSLSKATESEETTTAANVTTTEKQTTVPATQATTATVPAESSGTQSAFGELDVYPPYVTGSAKLMVVYTENSHLRLRSGNSLDYRIIEKLYDGTIVYVLYSADDWAFVACGRLYGWVHTDYIFEQDEYLRLTETTVPH